MTTHRSNDSAIAAQHALAPAAGQESWSSMAIVLATVPIAMALHTFRR